MRAFPVSLPSGQRYWTVLDEDLQVVGIADEYLRHQRFGRDGAESTTKGSIAGCTPWATEDTSPPNPDSSPPPWAPYAHAEPPGSANNKLTMHREALALNIIRPTHH